MKKIICLLILIPLISFSQSFTIEYDVTLNMLNRTGILNFNKNDISFYYESFKQKTSEDEKNQESGTLNKYIYLGGNNAEKRFQIYKSNNDTLLSVEYLDNKQIICIEKFPKFEWKFETETKLISNYLCSKATVFFRGRNYIAWYSTELPIEIGPWKFNNLPGAILQIYDETNSFSWSTTKITKNIEDKKLEIDKNLKQMTLQKYIEQDENLKREMSNKALLKYTERGSEVVERKYNRGRETKFEWEK